MTEFTVEINRRIRNATHMIYAEKQIVLPFAPFVGLVIANADGQEEEYKLERVSWDCVRKVFSVWTEDQKCSCDTDVIIAEETECGWTAEAARD